MLKLTGGMLQEKVDSDKKEDTEGKPDWRVRIRSLSKLQLIVGKFFVNHGIQSTFRLTYDKETSCCRLTTVMSGNNIFLSNLSNLSKVRHLRSDCFLNNRNMEEI
jgi:hypothetical protein